MPRNHFPSHKNQNHSHTIPQLSHSYSNLHTATHHSSFQLTQPTTQIHPPPNLNPSPHNHFPQKSNPQSLYAHQPPRTPTTIVHYKHKKYDSSHLSSVVLLFVFNLFKNCTKNVKSVKNGGLWSPNITLWSKK